MKTLIIIQYKYNKKKQYNYITQICKNIKIYIKLLINILKIEQHLKYNYNTKKEHKWEMITPIIQ